MKRLTTGVVAVLVLGALAAVMTMRAQSSGLSSDISAVKQLPPERAIPADVERWIETSSFARRNPSLTKRSVRKLRAGLGIARASLYAYESDKGSVCFYLQHQFSLCPDNSVAGNGGIHWVAGGGDGMSPPVFAGLVADDVSSVTLVQDSAARALEIRNNAVFAELSNSASTIEAVVKWKDGTETRRTIPPPGG